MAKLISRRDFLKGSAAGAFSLAAAGVFGTGFAPKAALRKQSMFPAPIPLRQWVWRAWSLSL